MMTISIDDLARVVGGAVKIPCDPDLPAPQSFEGNRAAKVLQAGATFAASPGFDPAEEKHYFSSSVPGTTQDHVATLCKTPEGRQYLSNMKSILDAP